MPSDKENQVTLHEHIETQLLSMERAIQLSREILDLRLASMNEFRQQLSDQSRTFMTKETYEKGHDYLSLRIEALQLSRAELTGKATQESVGEAQNAASRAYVLALISCGLTVLTLLGSVVSTLLHR